MIFLRKNNLKPAGLLVSVLAAILISGSLFAGKHNWNFGFLEFSFNGKTFSYDQGAIAILQKAQGKASRLVVGMSSAPDKLKLSMSVTLPQNFYQTVVLDSASSDLNLNFKQGSTGIMIFPALHLASNKSEEVLAKKQNRQARAPKWKNMDRASRLASGQGIIVDKKQAGNLAMLRLVPVVKNGKLIAIKGRFSGNAQAADGSTLAIQNGKFMLEVVSQ